MALLESITDPTNADVVVPYLNVNRLQNAEQILKVATHFPSCNHEPGRDRGFIGYGFFRALKLGTQKRPSGIVFLPRTLT
jgi:hypothetical protein